MFKKLCFLFLAVLSLPALTFADISWLPAESSYGEGKSFVDVSSMVPFPIPGMGGIGTTSEDPKAYGMGLNNQGGFTGGFVFGFVGTMPTGKPTFAQTELSGTALTAGTKVVLVFSKTTTDRINYMALTSNPATSGSNQILKYEVISDTKFRITATIVDPIKSASGDLGAAFGLYIDFQNNSSLDFDGTVFVTDMHYYDISAPTEFPSGLAGLSAGGFNGVAAQFFAFMPINFVTSMGLDPNNTGLLQQELQGYIDNTQVAQGKFENKGPDSSLGFAFNDSENPGNTVVVMSITNDVWSKHNIQFGKLIISAPTPTVTPTPTATPDVSGPTLVLIGKPSRTVKAASAKISGTVSDLAGVKKVEYSTKSSKSGYKAAKLKNGASWTISLTKLVKGKTVKVYVQATDNLGNKNTPLLVKVKRVK